MGSGKEMTPVSTTDLRSLIVRGVEKKPILRLNSRLNSIESAVENHSVGVSCAPCDSFTQTLATQIGEQAVVYLPVPIE